MAERRILIPADKIEFLERLTTSGVGPFKFQVDALAFAASLAAARDQTLPFTESAKEPIRQQVFENQGFGSLLGMLAVHKEQNPSLLSDDESMEERRAQIFEDYANAGLQILKDELRGAPNLSEAILLLLQKEKELSGQTAEDEVEFDLRSLLS